MSSRHSSQLWHALSDGSLNTVGETCSAYQVSLSTLSPSVWWPEPATPHRKVLGKVRWVMRGSSSCSAPGRGGLRRPAKSSSRRGGTRRWRYLASAGAGARRGPRSARDHAPGGGHQPLGVGG